MPCCRRREQALQLRLNAADQLAADLASQRQGEPVALTAVATLRDDGDGGLKPYWLLEGGTAELFDGAVLLVADTDETLCVEDGHCELYRLPPEQPAPVSVVLPFAEKIVSKLRRFMECTDDGQGADIGRHWFDVLTHLGLRNRVQRGPALWELTQQGEDCLEAAAALNSPQ